QLSLGVDSRLLLLHGRTLHRVPKLWPQRCKQLIGAPVVGPRMRARPRCPLSHRSIGEMQRAAQLPSDAGPRRRAQKHLLLRVELRLDGGAEMLGDVAHVTEARRAAG